MILLLDRCLELGSAYDYPAMFRLVQLWLKFQDDTKLQSVMQHATVNIASHKFLPLAYQMASRLSTDAGVSNFQVRHHTPMHTLRLNRHKLFQQVLPTSQYILSVLAQVCTMEAPGGIYICAQTQTATWRTKGIRSEILHYM